MCVMCMLILTEVLFVCVFTLTSVWMIGKSVKRVEKGKEPYEPKEALFTSLLLTLFLAVIAGIATKIILSTEFSEHLIAASCRVCG